jgi:hypothetical protein
LGADGQEGQHLLLAASQDEDAIDPLAGKVRGKIRVRYGGEDGNETASSPGSIDLQVDAAAYMSELRTEVSQLRDELTIARKEKEETLRKDLLLYIRTLPQKVGWALKRIQLYTIAVTASPLTRSLQLNFSGTPISDFWNEPGRPCRYERTR